MSFTVVLKFSTLVNTMASHLTKGFHWFVKWCYCREKSSLPPLSLLWELQFIHGIVCWHVYVYNCRSKTVSKRKQVLVFWIRRFRSLSLGFRLVYRSIIIEVFVCIHAPLSPSIKLIRFFMDCLPPDEEIEVLCPVEKMCGSSFSNVGHSHHWKQDRVLDSFLLLLLVLLYLTCWFGEK